MQVDGDRRRAGVSHKTVKPADRAQAHNVWEKDGQVSSSWRNVFCNTRILPVPIGTRLRIQSVAAGRVLGPAW